MEFHGSLFLIINRKENKELVPSILRYRLEENNSDEWIILKRLCRLQQNLNQIPL